MKLQKKPVSLIHIFALIAATALLVLSTVGCQGGEPADTINVVKEGADPKGEADCTDILQAVHEKAAAEGKKVYYPNGTYRYNGEYLNLSSGIKFQSIEGVLLKNDISEHNLFQHDDLGNFIGLIQNPLEKDESDLGGDEYSSGYLMNPPLFNKTYTRKVKDVIAWWYNDFGLECTRTKSTGWIGWYYWTWNHHNCQEKMASMAADGGDPYDASRHPLLGFYKGDDPVVQDWITYWMLEYGINTVGLLSVTPPYSSENYTFEDPGHRDHWMYQWLENCPNSKNMKYLLCPEVYWGLDRSETDRERNATYILRMIDKTYGQYPDNVYTVTYKGKEYPVIFFKEEGALLDTYDNAQQEAVNTLAFYKRISDKCKSLGWPGVAIMASTSASIAYFDTFPEKLEEMDVIRFYGRYGSTHTSEKAATMQEMVDRFKTTANNTFPNTVAGLMIAKETHSPHQSGFTVTGHSPQVLGSYLDKVLEAVAGNDIGLYDAISLHNVSEWAECGPGLIPNMQDRFAYLQTIKDKVVVGEK